MQQTPTQKNKKRHLVSLHKSESFNMKLREQLATVRKQLGQERKIRAHLEIQALQLEDAKIAARNVLEDLQEETEILARTNAKDEAVFESLGEGLIAVDKDRKVMHINKIAIEMLGWKSKSLIGKVITELPLEDEAGNSIPLNKRATSLALLTGKISKVTYYFVRKDKTRFPIAITATPILLGGETIGLIEIFRDVTKEKEIDKEKSEFVSLASHQLRTPLTAISWYTEMILSGDIGKVVPEQKKYLEEIYQGNRRMVELVNTLLDVSRIDLGTFVIQAESTDVIALAESVLHEQKSSIEIKKLVITKTFNKQPLIFLIDPKLLRMVFQNLLSNAVKYTQPGGKIELNISFDNKKNLNFKISDNGYGIPQNQQSKIFTKFFRADNVKAKDTEGTGLGLYLVKSIAEKFGGKIWFESKEGNGSTFNIMFPVHSVKK